MKLYALFYFLFFNFVNIFKCQEEDILIIPSEKKFLHLCENNIYQFQFDIQLSKKFDGIIPFEMVIPLPYTIPFKCIINGPKSHIYCFHSFQNYVWSLPDNSKIELPNSFPEIKGIRWDYDSFLRKIYRYLWNTKGNCGLIYQTNPKVGKNNNLDANQNQEVSKSGNIQIVADIEEISEGECHSSQFDYSFNMKLALYDGEIIEELKNSKVTNKTTSIKFLHEIYLPILMGYKMKKGKTAFLKDYEYNYAMCTYDKELTQNNFDSLGRVTFVCHLNINKYIRFKGPVQIKPFTDYVYIEKTDNDGIKTISKIGIKFEILSSFETANNNQFITSGNTANNNLKNQVGVNEPNFLILNSNLNTFICPDKPILVVKNYDEGITFGGLNASGSKYLFLIYGYLTNGYEYVNDTLTIQDMTKEEIKFYLKITDILENPDDKRKSVKCHIPTGTSINQNVLIEVKCIGTRANLNNNNTDIILNWNIEENLNLKNIMIQWPYDLTKKKHIFYYNIKGLSVKRDNFGCYGNKFYFYLYVYDLKSEPNISFNLPLIYPKNSYANCKLYNSVTFKCLVDLRLKKISKGSNIILPSKMNEYLPNNEKNVILYSVNATNYSSVLDFQLPIEENCGDLKLVGAIKDIGFSYTEVIIIIVCIFVGIFICVSGIVFCIVYEIIYKNRKGRYFKYAEEKEIPNTSVSQNQPPVA